MVTSGKKGRFTDFTGVLKMIEVDGSIGGGQVARLAVALSALTSKEAHVFNIRKDRPKPGLKHQHLAGMEALSDLCGGKLENAKLGSDEIWFRPGRIKAGNLKVKIPTAGSIGLVLQSLMLPCAFADGEVKIEISGGATCGEWSPQVDYVKLVLLPLLRKAGYDAEIEIVKRGYYPSGGARVLSVIRPWKDKVPLNLEESGKVLEVRGVVHSSKQLEKAKVAERIEAEARKRLVGKVSSGVKISTEYVDALSAGCGILLYALCENSVIGVDALGRIGKPAEEVGREAALGLVSALETKCGVDRHALDQLIPYLAVAGGGVTSGELTQHALSSIEVAEKFLPAKFEVYKMGTGDKAGAGSKEKGKAIIRAVRI